MEGFCNSENWLVLIDTYKFIWTPLWRTAKEQQYAINDCGKKTGKNLLTLQDARGKNLILHLKKRKKNSSLDNVAKEQLKD